MGLLFLVAWVPKLLTSPLAQVGVPTKLLGAPAIADMLSLNYEPLPMRNTGTLQLGSITAAMPSAQSGGMGMLPILHTSQALQLKVVAAGRSVLSILQCAFRGRAVATRVPVFCYIYISQGL